MPKKRDFYDGKRKSPGIDIPNTYTASRSAAPLTTPAKDRAASSGGVLYEPSFQGAALGAAINDGMAGAYAGNKPPLSQKNTERADEIADRLVAILEQESTLYQDASIISAKKTDVIVHGKIEELDSLVKAEQAIILKISKLENEREKIVDALSNELELDLEGVTLSDINSRLGSDSYARLDQCQQSLAHTLGGLKNSNDMNAQLIQNALDYVNFSVNLLTTNQNTGNLYSQDGDDSAGNQRRNIFDVKL